MSSNHNDSQKRIYIQSVNKQTSKNNNSLLVIYHNSYYHCFLSLYCRCGNIIAKRRNTADLYLFFILIVGALVAIRKITVRAPSYQPVSQSVRRPGLQHCRQRITCVSLGQLRSSHVELKEVDAPTSDSSCLC